MSIYTVRQKLDTYSFSWGLNKIWDTEVRDVTLCQRIIRRFLATKRLGVETADALIPKMRHWTEQSIARYPCVPLLTLDLDPMKRDALVLGCDERTKAAVAKFLSPPVLKKIDFPHFLSALQCSLNRTLEFLMLLPPEDRGYLIVVDEREKSNSWVVSLVSKQLARLPPIDVVHRDTIGRVIENKAIRHIFLMDDAAYSGKQMTSTLVKEIFPRLELCNHIKAVHLVIPFVTDGAEQKIAIQDRFQKSCFLSSYEKMPLISQLPHKGCGITDSDLTFFTKFLETKFNLGKSEVLNRTLTYFDHKIADHLSTPGKLISELVGGIIPPYKCEYDTILDQHAIGKVDEDFVMIQNQGKYFVVPKSECDDLCIVRDSQEIALMPLEMFELKAGDWVILEDEKFAFDGEKLIL